MKPTDTVKGSTQGMWLFLYSEIMLFGGLFVIYANYYYRYAENFAVSARELSTFVGTLNTVILLGSSFTVAAAVVSLRRGFRRRAAWLLGSSVLLGLGFLVNKYFEWSHKFHDGIYPGSDRFTGSPQGEQIFFGLYFTMTGLHALHVLVGILLLSFCLVWIVKGRLLPGHSALLHNCGLYWHLVDLIWIFLFPLLYLIL